MNNKKYTFQINEQPGFDKISEFCLSKGYSEEVALIVFKKLLSSNYSTSGGVRIKFIDSWIENELKNHKPSIYSDKKLKDLIEAISDRYTFYLFDDTLEAQQQALNIRFKIKEIVESAIQVYGKEKTAEVLEYISTIQVNSQTFYSPSQIKTLFKLDKQTYIQGKI